MPKKLAIDILKESGGRADLVIKAVRMHMACPCDGGGACAYYPEQPCPNCGFTFADSVGVEKVVEDIERMDKGNDIRTSKTS